MSACPVASVPAQLGVRRGGPCWTSRRARSNVRRLQVLARRRVASYRDRPASVAGLVAARHHWQRLRVPPRRRQRQPSRYARCRRTLSLLGRLPTRPLRTSPALSSRNSRWATSKGRSLASIASIGSASTSGCAGAAPVPFASTAPMRVLAATRVSLGLIAAARAQFRLSVSPVLLFCGLGAQRGAQPRRGRSRVWRVHSNFLSGFCKSLSYCHMTLTLGWYAGSVVTSVVLHCSAHMQPKVPYAP